MERIFARESQIKEMPLSGRVVPDYNISNIRELIEGSYRIIYLIQTDKILIISVMHQSRLISKVKLLKDAAVKMAQAEQAKDANSE